MDRMGANFFRTVDMIVKNLGAKPLVIQVPIGAEEEFAGVVDLVENKAIVWSGEELGASFEYQEIPDDLKEKCEEMRSQLIETAVEQDEDIMMMYLEGEEPSVEDLKSASVRAASTWTLSICLWLCV